MRSYDGAETCELVGLYMLSRLKQYVPPHQIGLYRDDGLAIIPEANGPKMDRIRKQITSVFKEEGLKITVETNAEEVDFLDVTLNTVSGKYFPYRKPNDNPLYINTQSNHPPTIIKQLPKMINQRLSSISCNEEEFNRAKGVYEDALKSSGYNYQLQYTDTEHSANPTPPRRKRSRKIIWYNPPYSADVSTNIGKKFFWLLAKHFPKGHRLNKLFNRNTVKLSYSCMPNIASVLSSTRQQLKEPETGKMCNCRRPADCPLAGECLHFTVSSCIRSNTRRRYSYNNAVQVHRVTENTFKSRFSSHTSSFKHEKLKNSMELSKKVWELKESSTPYKLTWKVLQHGQPYI